MRAAPCAVAVAPRGCRGKGGFVPQTIGVGWTPTDEAGLPLRYLAGSLAQVVAQARCPVMTLAAGARTPAGL